MQKMRLCFALWLLLSSAGNIGAEETKPVPYLVLVSLDGFRYDYAERYQAKNLLEIGNAGITAQAVIPSFPTVTFPNHLSIITGLHPEHHGIVSNVFLDPSRKEKYSLNKTAADGTWYSGTPLWVLAESQHVKAASMFWPGSEAEIGGFRPTYWKHYSDDYPNDDRVQQVIDWLRLPEEQRPHFITLYFSDVDTAGHHFGPDAPETAAAVQRVDGLIGSLRRGIADTGLPVNMVVVSDHGMQAIKGFVDLSTWTDTSRIEVETDGPMALIYTTSPGETSEVYKALKGKSPEFEVYRRGQTPAKWHIRTNPRAGELVVMLNEPAAVYKTTPTKAVSKGIHGFDPAAFPTMRGIFYASGPNIRQARVAPFGNVDIYPFLARILGLKITARIDGSAKTLGAFVK